MDKRRGTGNENGDDMEGAMPSLRESVMMMVFVEVLLLFRSLGACLSLPRPEVQTWLTFAAFRNGLCLAVLALSFSKLAFCGSS